MGVVTIADETTSGERGDTWMLDVAEERLALREVIRRDLDAEVELPAGTEVTFMKLMPLVGG